MLSNKLKLQRIVNIARKIIGRQQVHVFKIILFVDAAFLLSCTLILCGKAEADNFPQCRP